MSTQDFKNPSEGELEAMNSSLQAPAGPKIDGPIRYFSPQWMQQPVGNKERSRPIIGDLIHENDFVLLVADSGTGKSATGVYMMRCAMRHDDCFLDHPKLRSGCEKLSCSYHDLETNEEQFRARHSSIWPGAQYRDHKALGIDKARDKDGSWNFDKVYEVVNLHNEHDRLKDYFNDAIQNGVRFHIIDSITELTDDPKPKDLIRIMQKIRAIQDAARRIHNHSVTVVADAHIAKHTEIGKYLTAADTYGAMQQVAKVDVVIRMANAKREGEVYLKMVKLSRDRPGAFTGGDNGEVLLFKRQEFMHPVHGRQYYLKIEEEDKYSEIAESEVMPMPLNAPIGKENRDSKEDNLVKFLMEYYGKDAAEGKVDTITPGSLKSKMTREKKKQGDGFAYQCPNENTISTLWFAVRSKLITQGTDQARAIHQAMEK